MVLIGLILIRIPVSFHVIIANELYQDNFTITQTNVSSEVSNLS